MRSINTAWRRLKLIKDVIKEGGFEETLNLMKNGIGVSFEPLNSDYSPMLIIIEPTNRCNLRCTTCINKEFDKCNDLSIDEFKQIINRFPYVRKIGLTGVGEPLMNKHIFDMVKYAKGKNIEIGFTTNGILLNKERAIDLTDSGLDWLSFSVDSPVKETYENIRVGAKFDKMKENIAQFVDISKGKLTLNILVVVTNDNINELPLFVPLLKELGIIKLDFQSTHYWGSNEFKLKMKDKIIGTDGATIEYIRKVKRDALNNGIECSFMNFPDIERGRKCKWPWRACYISVDGYVTPCCLGGADHRKINFGNIFDSISFDEIWNGKGYINFRKALKSNKPPMICVGCPNYYGFKTI